MARRSIRPVVVKDVTIGDGIPKIFVPIAGAGVEELERRADALAGRGADVVEWRADGFRELGDPAAVAAAARSLAGRLAGRPLLFTCRGEQEGGEAALGDEAYAALGLALIDSGAADLVDVECARDRAVVERLIAAAHERDVAVIGSSHDFAATPPREEIVARLRAMQELGTDICKVAVTPQSPADVLTLLEATLEMRERWSDRPLMTISMGRLGVVSRIAGHVFGSDATFASSGDASAPGQLDVGELRRAFELLERAS